MIKTPTWYVFHMYKAHQDAALLESTVSTDEVCFEDSPKIKAITSSASHKDNVYTITLTNADLESKRNVKILLQGINGKIKKASAVYLTGEKMNTANTFDSPNQVVEKSMDVKICGNEEIEVELPNMSVVQVTVEI